MTPDHLPRIYRLDEGLYTPIGYNGRGITPGTIFGKAMAEQKRGAIINYSSMAVDRAITRVAGYSASKAAVMHLSKIMAKELAGYNVTVNALAPGPFVSRMTAFATADEEKRAKVGSDVPLGRVGRDEDIAGCILFLCGRGGAYVTGAIIPVSGGINVMSGHNIFEKAL